MASDPTVCCIMLTKDRPEFAARAVRCFRAQTYFNKQLVIVDNGISRFVSAEFLQIQTIPASIGKLRNLACESTDADIIIHYDDDDYSHPNRLAEQVAFLQSSGAAVVGYNQMLFWRSKRKDEVVGATYVTACGEAWLYTGPAHQPLGTSLCYWRSTWESHRFDDRKHAGEDSDFLARVGHRRVKSVSSLADGLCHAGVDSVPREPRMLATVHGANTQQKTYDGFFKGGTVEMRRVAEWDDRVRQVLEGA